MKSGIRILRYCSIEYFVVKFFFSVRAVYFTLKLNHQKALPKYQYVASVEAKIYVNTVKAGID